MCAPNHVRAKNALQLSDAKRDLDTNSCILQMNQQAGFLTKKAHNHEMLSIRSCKTRLQKRATPKTSVQKLNFLILLFSVRK